MENNLPGLKRELGLLDSTMIVIGSMIGSGIFIVSADIARSVGSPAWLILVWLAAGLITLLAALSYGELAGMMPKAGGQYVYLREAYNPLIGFLYGWTLFMVIQTGTIAAVAVAFAKFTSVIIPEINSSAALLHFGVINVYGNQLIAIASVILLTFINSRGVKTGKYLQLVFTLTKIAALFILILLGIFLARNAFAIEANFTHFWQKPFTMTPLGNHWIKTFIHGPSIWLVVGGAMVGSLFSSDAWNNITFTAGEVKNPQKNIPLSLFFGTLTVTIIYILVNISYLMLLPINGSPGATDVIHRGIMFASEDRVATASSAIIFGHTAVWIMAILIMISTFGCNNGLIMAGARVYYAMAIDKLFFSRAATLNKSAVPGFALLIQCIWTCLLCLSGGYSALLDYVIFAVLVFYILTVAAVIVLRIQKPLAERPYKTWGYPLVPSLYILLASALAIDLLVEKWQTSRWGALLVLVGIPIYYVNKRVFQRSGNNLSDNKGAATNKDHII